MLTTHDIEKHVCAGIMNSPKLCKLVSGDLSGEDEPMLLSFAVAGLNEEAGEVSGLVCREMYKNMPMPQDRWLEELGDVLWYLTTAALALGFNLEQLYNYNVKKLEERYGKT